jgi:RhtB (resistance to homoserine/threonine) family protein
MRNHIIFLLATEWAYNKETFLMAGIYTITIIAILGALSPGPDFIVVSRNAIAQHRRAGLLTSFGLGPGIMIHGTYCILGLALIISQSLIAFSMIRYIGAAYLIYLGIKSLLIKQKSAEGYQANKAPLTNWQAYRDGLLVNLLNPKCIIFMLAIFTTVIKPDTTYAMKFIYAADLALITMLWFCILSIILKHQRVKQGLGTAQHLVSKVMGCFLIVFGLDLLLR